MEPGCFDGSAWRKKASGKVVLLCCVRLLCAQFMRRVLRLHTASWPHDRKGKTMRELVNVGDVWPGSDQTIQIQDSSGQGQGKAIACHDLLPNLPIASDQTCDLIGQGLVTGPLDLTLAHRLTESLRVRMLRDGKEMSYATFGDAIG